MKVLLLMLVVIPLNNTAPLLEVMGNSSCHLVILQNFNSKSRLQQVVLGAASVATFEVREFLWRVREDSLPYDLRTTGFCLNYLLVVDTFLELKETFHTVSLVVGFKATRNIFVLTNNSLTLKERVHFVKTFPHIKFYFVTHLAANL